VELLKARGLSRVDLCGLSLGAAVALEFAVTRPERVHRLILCAGSGFDREREARSLAAAGMHSLVCCGERDEANLGMGGELAGALGTSLVVVPGAGHVANLDAPQAFSALLTGGDVSGPGGRS
jgi:pimeloyl-ACP methyl ester carboxylesterase